MVYTLKSPMSTVNFGSFIHPTGPSPVSLSPSPPSFVTGESEPLILLLISLSFSLSPSLPVCLQFSLLLSLFWGTLSLSFRSLELYSSNPPRPPFCLTSSNSSLASYFFSNLDSFSLSTSRTPRKGLYLCGLEQMSEPVCQDLCLFASAFSPKISPSRSLDVVSSDPVTVSR